MPSVSDHLRLCFICFQGISHTLPAYTYAQRITHLVEEEKIRYIKRRELGPKIYAPTGRVTATIFCQIKESDLPRFLTCLIPTNDIDIVVRVVEDRELLPTTSSDSSDGQSAAAKSTDRSTVSMKRVYSLFVQESISGAWSRRIINYYRNGWQTVEQYKEVNDRVFATTLLGDQAVQYLHITTRPSMRTGAPMARPPHCVIADMFVSFDGEVAKAFGNIPCWSFHPSNVIVAGFDYRRRSLELNGMCTFNNDELMEKPFGDHAFHAEVLRRPYRKGIIVNDVEDWYTHDVLDAVANKNLIRPDEDEDSNISDECSPIANSQIRTDQSDGESNESCRARWSRYASEKPTKADEPQNADQGAHEIGPENQRLTKPWQVLCVGPLLLTTIQAPKKHDPLEWWYDQVREVSGNFIYVTMGSQYDLPSEVFATLLDRLTKLLKNAPDSRVLWAHRPPKGGDPPDLGSPLIANGRILMRPWVDQVQALQSQSLIGVISHAGWNGLLEAMTLSKVPILCLPLGAEQGINARCVEEFYMNGRILKGRHSDKMKAHLIRQTWGTDGRRLTCLASETQPQLLREIALRAFNNSSKRNVYTFLSTLL